MNKLKNYLTIVLSLLSCFVFANNISLEGVVTEKHNKGFRMVGAKVEVIDANTQTVKESLVTDELGRFKIEVAKNQNYIIKVLRKNFTPFVKEVSIDDSQEKDIVILNVVMERKPGYVFDVTLTESLDKGTVEIAAIKDARIEVYNNTSNKSELELEKHAGSTFQFVFESGNYYTIMIRKKGFFNKRIEAYIDIEGCILCFDGLDLKRQELIGSTSEDNKRGTFLADIKLQPIEKDITFEIENIYYDFDKSNIRKDAASELDKLTNILRDNQHVLLELGAHTDARGDDDYNLKLSNERAKAAVKYLTAKHGISDQRLTWKGYGESQLLNQCGNGIECPEESHQRNRRTELKIIGSLEDPLDKMSLKEIIEQGKRYELLTKSK